MAGTEEEGINSGGRVDTKIDTFHGTPYEEHLGKPVSSGCIRMSNQDIIELFNHARSKPKLILLLSYHVSLFTDIDGTKLTDEDGQTLLHPAVSGVILFSRNFHNIAQLEQLIKKRN